MLFHFSISATMRALIFFGTRWLCNVTDIFQFLDNIRFGQNGRDGAIEFLRYGARQSAPARRCPDTRSQRILENRLRSWSVHLEDQRNDPAPVTANARSLLFLMNCTGTVGGSSTRSSRLPRRSVTPACRLCMVRAGGGYLPFWQKAPSPDASNRAVPGSAVKQWVALRDRAMLTMSATVRISLSGYVTSTSGYSAVVLMNVKSSVGLYGRAFGTWRRWPDRSPAGHQRIAIGRCTCDQPASGGAGRARFGLDNHRLAELPG